MPSRTEYIADRTPQMRIDRSGLAANFILKSEIQETSGEPRSGPETPASGPGANAANGYIAFFGYFGRGGGGGEFFKPSLASSIALSSCGSSPFTTRSGRCSTVISGSTP